MKRAGACPVAALGAGAGTASAQSGVTLYGVADVYMEYVKSGANHAMRIEDGGLYQSRWGLRGKGGTRIGTRRGVQPETGRRWTAATSSKADGCSAAVRGSA